ncbi:unnamed protein product, partial [Hapterophycus canaliculatus]
KWLGSTRVSGGQERRKNKSRRLEREWESREMRSSAPCRDSCLESISAATRDDEGRSSMDILQIDQLSIDLSEDKLEEVRLYASSPPAEGFATTAEKAAWKSIRRVMSRRLQRCVSSRMRRLEKMWEGLHPLAQEAFMLEHPKRRSTR